MPRPDIVEADEITPTEKLARENELVEALEQTVSSPEFVERARAADLEGRLSLANMEALQQLGVTGMVLNKHFGPDGASVEAAVRVMETLSYYDGSTAVAVNMGWGGARGLAQMPSFSRRDEAVAAIAAGTGTVCGAMSISSTEGLDSRKAGMVCRDEGDAYVFNGRSGFASGSDAATHTFLGALLEGSDPADPEYVITLGRMGEPGLILHQNWDALGMRGTGSNDIECKELAIAKADCFTGPLSAFRYRRPVDTVYTSYGIAAIWLGLSRAAFDFTIDHVKNRYGYMASSSLDVDNQSYRADEAWAQTAIGNMDHWLGTGHALMRDALAHLGDYDSDDLMGRDTVRTIFHLRRMAEEVAMGAMKTCGAHGYVRSRSLERTFRDLIGGVVMAWKTDDLQQKLGIGALGRPIIIGGPAGT